MYMVAHWEGADCTLTGFSRIRGARAKETTSEVPGGCSYGAGRGIDRQGLTHRLRSTDL